MIKTISALALLAAAAGGSYWGWEKYEYQQEKKSVANSSREVSALIGRQLALDTSTTVTFGEYIKTSEQSIASIDASMLVLSTKKYTRASAAAEAVTEFSADAQEYMRLSVSLARAQMKASTAGKLADDAFKEFETSKNKYTISSALERSSKYRKEQLEEMKKAQAAERSVKPKLKNIYASDYKVKGELGQDEGLDPVALKALLTSASK